MRRVKLKVGRSSPGRSGTQPAKLQAKRNAAREAAEEKRARRLAAQRHAAANDRAVPRDRAAEQLRSALDARAHEERRAAELTPYQREALRRAGVGHYGPVDLGAWVNASPYPPLTADCGALPDPVLPFFATRKLKGITCPRCLLLTDLGQEIGLLTLVRGELVDAQPGEPSRRSLRKRYLRACRASRAQVALTAPDAPAPGTLASLPVDERCEGGDVRHRVVITYSEETRRSS